MKKVLLDSSLLIDLLNEIADDSKGPGFEWLERNEKAQIWISPVTMAEGLEGVMPARRDPWHASYDLEASGSLETSRGRRC